MTDHSMRDRTQYAAESVEKEIDRKERVTGEIDAKNALGGGDLEWIQNCNCPGPLAAYDITKRKKK